MKKCSLHSGVLQALFLLFTIPVTLPAYTEIPGQTLETNTTLSAGTYLLQGTLVVPEGITLTLQPGAVIKVNSWWHRIEVDGGVIRANAGGQTPIVFTSSNDSAYGEAIPGAGEAGPDQWGGILLGKTVDTQVPARGTFNNCIFRYGGGWSFAMLETIDSHLHVETCRFEASAEVGIKIEGGAVLNSSQPVIRDSVFLNNLRCGIYGKQNPVPDGWRTVPVIQGCTFDGNRSYAMEFYDCVFPDFDGSNQLIQRASVGNGIAWNGSTNVQHRLEYPGPGFPYVMTGGFTVSEGASLTVEAGVIVKTNSWWHRLTVTAATLSVNGTEQMPVYFTSYWDDSIGGDTNGDGNITSGAPDQWGGVRLLPAMPPALTPSSGQFTHTHFRNGGGWTVSMLDIEGSSASLTDCSFTYSAEEGSRVTATEAQAADVRFTRCEFSENGTLGFHILHTHEAGTSKPVFNNCVFRGNAVYAGRINGNVFPVTNRSNQIIITQGVVNGVAIGHGITQSGRLQAFGSNFPYILTANLNIPHTVSLTIGAGTVVKANSWWHRFNVAGNLIVEGANGDPVTFTSLWDDGIAGDSNGDLDTTQPAPDQWGGLYLYRQQDASLSGSLTATHMHLYYGGGWTNSLLSSTGGNLDCSHCLFAYSAEAGVAFTQEENRTATLSFRSCEFLSNGTEGLSIHHESGALKPVLSRCRFSGNSGFAARFRGDVFPQFDGTTTIAQGGDTANNGFAIEGTIESTGTLEYPGNPAPYILSAVYNIQPGATVSIEPGVVIKANNWWHYLLVDGGTLNASGTARRPISFTSYWDDTAAGDTNGDGSETDAGPDQWGGLLARNNGSITLDYCRLKFGGGYTNALLSLESSTATATNCVFTRSSEHAVYANGTSSVLVSDSVITENGTGGISMSSNTHMIDARGNYWGHASGPLDNSDAEDLVKAGDYTFFNPDGMGQAVSNNVLYDGWLGAAPVWESYVWWDATDAGGGWLQSGWYGWFNDLLYPFIYHLEHGWQYCLGDSQDNLSVYDYSLQCWFSVRRQRYPLIYLSGRHAGWYWYFKGGQSPNRWFYSYASGQYVNEKDLL